MSDPIRDALDWLNQRLLPTLFSKGVDAAFLQSWASHARAALAAQPPVGDDDDRAALQGLLDRVHLAATDPAAWFAMCYARQVLADTPRAVLGAQPPADAPSPAPVAWCSSSDFLAAAEKRQSFSGWRERYSDCDMALYAAPAPVAWPELPNYPEEWRTENHANTAYVSGLRIGYEYAREKLAAMNPNHQQENYQ